MNNDTAALNAMIRALNDGRAFYQEAASKVMREDLKRLFDRMAKTKAAIVQNMQNKVILSGNEPSDEGTFAGGMRQAYAAIRARLSSDKEASYVSELEGCEDRIVASFREAIAGSKDPAVRGIAERYLPDVTRDHDEIRALKHAIPN